MKPKRQTVVVTLFRNGSAISTKTLTVEEFRRKHPASDAGFNNQVRGRGRPAKAEANVFGEMREDDEHPDVPMSPALARLLGQF